MESGDPEATSTLKQCLAEVVWSPWHPLHATVFHFLLSVAQAWSNKLWIGWIRCDGSGALCPQTEWLVAVPRWDGWEDSEEHQCDEIQIWRALLQHDQLHGQRFHPKAPGEGPQVCPEDPPVVLKLLPLLPQTFQAQFVTFITKTWHSKKKSDFYDKKIKILSQLFVKFEILKMLNLVFVDVK